MFKIWNFTSIYKLAFYGYAVTIASLTLTADQKSTALSILTNFEFCVTCESKSGFNYPSQSVVYPNIQSFYSFASV
jgi:hypothetical protein